MLTMEEDPFHNEPACQACTSLVSEPYIHCAECPQHPDTSQVTICLHCFAKGVEFGSHKSDHSYSIVKNNFPLFERSWTAVEEVQLIKAVSECGYGNWTDIAHRVRSKNHVECERHYNLSYIDNPAEGLPKFPEAELDIFPCPVVYKLCEDPPRPSEGSILTTEMAGYMAGRGDFMTEYMNYMELDLRGLEFETTDEELEKDLKVSVIHVYQRCLQERRRRKRLIRRYGLINMRKNLRLRQRYERTLGPHYDRLLVFAQALDTQSYELFLESIHYERELKNEIHNLQEYRRNGLKKLRHIKMFRVLRKNRENDKRERHLLNDVISHMKDETACQSWLQRQAVLDSIGKGVQTNLPSAPRRPAPPLDITELPGVEKLSHKERELCSHIRLVPSAYLEFKAQLQAECNKLGSLKLAQARLLIKIDVNKTRKIFDFLVSEGIITKD